MMPETTETTADGESRGCRPEENANLETRVHELQSRCTELERANAKLAAERDLLAEIAEETPSGVVWLPFKTLGKPVNFSRSSGMWKSNHLQGEYPTVIAAIRAALEAK